jgi:hypothetical protein
MDTMINVRDRSLLFQNKSIFIEPTADGVNAAKPVCNITEAKDSTLGSEPAPKGSVYSVQYEYDPSGQIDIPAGKVKGPLTMKGPSVSFHLSGASPGKSLQSLELYCVFPGQTGLVTDRDIYETLGLVLHFQPKEGVELLTREEAKKELSHTVVRESVTVTAAICDDNPLFEIEALGSADGKVLIYSHGQPMPIDEAKIRLANSGESGCGFELIPLPAQAETARTPRTTVNRNEKLISCDRQISTRFNQSSGLLEADIMLTAMETNAKMVCIVGPKKDANGDYKIKFDLSSVLTKAFSVQDTNPMINVDVKRQAEFRTVMQ